MLYIELSHIITQEAISCYNSQLKITPDPSRPQHRLRCRRVQDTVSRTSNAMVPQPLPRADGVRDVADRRPHLLPNADSIPLFE